MKASLLLRFVRVGFLPLLLASSTAMVFGVRSLYPTRPLDWQIWLLVCGNVAWMLYGSVLNDICDHRIDCFNRAARKLLVEYPSAMRHKWRMVLGSLGVATLLDGAVFAWLAWADSATALLVFLPTSIVGVALATAYSLPPVRARARLFGATWSLMAYHPFCFFRILAVSVRSSDLLPLHNNLLIVAAFLWACHGITTAAMKDVPDTFADRVEGTRSLPNLYGPSVSTLATVAFVGLTGTIATFAWLQGFLDARFFLFLVPMAFFYCWLAAHLHQWFARALKDESVASQTPRRFFHAVAYLGTWGFMIPAFLLNLCRP